MIDPDVTRAKVWLNEHRRASYDSGVADLLAEYAAAAAVEPRGCPTPGACSCVAAVAARMTAATARETAENIVRPFATGGGRFADQDFEGREELTLNITNALAEYAATQRESQGAPSTGDAGALAVEVRAKRGWGEPGESHDDDCESETIAPLGDTPCDCARRGGAAPRRATP